MESSDIQSAVARTQQAGRIQQQAAEQEEMRRKRFELERTRELADSSKKIQGAEETAERRAIKDKWDGEGSGGKKDARDEPASDPAGAGPAAAGSAAPPTPVDGTPGTQGGIDVRV